MTSHCVDPYLSEFAAIVSFALNVTCTPDSELARRLTSGRRGFSTNVPPRRLVRLAFDDQVWCREGDADHLVRIVDELIGLKRKCYLAVKRAIRNYVTGLHRLADDPELTYTLLVASIESLTQNFEGPSPNWEDYPEEKRRRIDEALEKGDEETKERVKKALLDMDHTAAKRRFCDFVFEHIQPTFFREEALRLDNPIGRSHLYGALKKAYDLRSRHIHTLKELPELLTAGFSHGEIYRANRETMLTFQGMSRLARHVITEYIARQPKVDTEDYDYRPERAGIVTAPLAPKYWVGRVENLNVSSGQRQLEGFLCQVGAVVAQETDATLTDLQNMLVQVEKMLPKMNGTQRKPFLTIYILYNRLVLPDTPMENFEKVNKRYLTEIKSPSVEAMLLHLLLGIVPEWSNPEHYAVHDNYLRDQGKRSCLKVPQNLKTGLSLTLAERYRVSGEEERARDLISVAVENCPGNTALYQLEQTFAPELPIGWAPEAGQPTASQSHR